MFRLLARRLALTCSAHGAGAERHVLHRELCRRRADQQRRSALRAERDAGARTGQFPQCSSRYANQFVVLGAWSIGGVRSLAASARKA
jgi:hypothetical protein